jgi:hypothetical protein
MKQNLLKLMRIAGTVGMAVGNGIIIGAIIGALVYPVRPAPESAAAFKSWEAQQARQGGRGAAQSGEVSP